MNLRFPPYHPSYRDDRHCEFHKYAFNALGLSCLCFWTGNVDIMMILDAMGRQLGFKDRSLERFPEVAKGAQFRDWTRARRG